MSIMESRSRQARDKLGALEQVALAMVEDVLILLATDKYKDLIEELIDMSDIDMDSEEADDILNKRYDAAEEKVTIRAARALLNMSTGRSDKVASLAIRAVDRDI